jgi:hypothetical protein
MLDMIERLMSGLDICVTLYRNDKSRGNRGLEGLLPLVSSHFAVVAHFWS